MNRHPSDTSVPPSPEPLEQSKAGRITAIVIVASLLAMWIWIWGFAPRDNVDRFSERTFPAAAEPICAAAQEAILALPSGHETPTVAARAATVRTGTEIVETMVADLEDLADLVTDPDDAVLLQLWFDDWHGLYLADRWAHVERLESATPDTPDEDLAFLVHDLRYGRKIDGLANVNDMASCVIPGDI